MPTKNKLFSLLLIIGLLVALFITLILVSKRQEIRKKAGASEVQLALYPTTENIPIGGTKTFDLIATFTGGSSTERLDYLKTEVNFSKEYLKMSQYADTEFPNQVNFDRLFRIDGPQAANESGKIVIELGAASKGSGPPTDKPLTIVRIYFEGVKQTPSVQDLTVGTTEVVNSQSAVIPPALSPAKYTVGGRATPSPLPPSTPTPTPRIGGVSPSPTKKPSSLTPTPTEEAPSPTPTRKATPSPTVPPTGVVTSSPTGDQGQVTIPIGDKDSLTVNIRGGSTGGDPQVRFKAKLAGLEKTPDLLLKLRIKDELAFMDDTQAGGESSLDQCHEPYKGGGDFMVPVRAQDGIYTPTAGAFQTTGNLLLASVSDDGWVTLTGIVPGRYYTIFLKGPKTRATKVVEHFVLKEGKSQQQEFDWTGNTLEPGDLPNPNNGGRQDCTVNSIDLSLIMDRIGATEEDHLMVADVNYDGVVNGNDISKVVNTLSTKPDDDL